jgi:hypothetical protein
LPPSCAQGLEILEALRVPEFPGILRARPGLCRDCFNFIYFQYAGSVAELLRRERVTVQIGTELDKPKGWKQTPEVVFLDDVMNRTGLF